MNDAGRITGRTTGRILRAMADASLRRGEWIEFNDHCDQSPEESSCLLAAMQQMAEALGLDYDIHIRGGLLRSQLVLRWPKEQSEPATVSDASLGRNRIGIACWYRPAEVDGVVCEAGRWRAGRLCAWSTDCEAPGPFPVGVIVDDEHGTCHSICVKRICFAGAPPADRVATKDTTDSTGG